MKKLIILAAFPLFLTCSQYAILSDLTNNRMQLILKGTYESNNPYAWNTNLYEDDVMGTYPAPVSDVVPFSNVDMYLDISDIRMATGTGKPANVTPENYWTYFTRQREVFCSSNVTPSNYDLVSCRDNNGDLNYSDFFSSGFAFPATDVPANTYKHLAIFFRKIVTSPSLMYNSSYANGFTQTTLFDNRVVNGIDLMDSILSYADSDSARATPLLTPLERTDLNLVIPSGNEPYVLEVRVFLKNLLMKHVIKYGDYPNNSNTAVRPLTFVGPSDWKVDHKTTDYSAAFRMGNHLIFTARVYDPANIGHIKITDTEALPAYKSYYAAVPAGATFSNTQIPYAATSRTDVGGTTTEGTIKNLPPGNYDIYKTCDRTLLTAAGTAAGEDGFPETSVSCATNVAVTAGSTTTKAITCLCP